MDQYGVFRSVALVVIISFLLGMFAMNSCHNWAEENGLTEQETNQTEHASQFNNESIYVDKSTYQRQVGDLNRCIYDRSQLTEEVDELSQENDSILAENERLDLHNRKLETQIQTATSRVVALEESQERLQLVLAGITSAESILAVILGTDTSTLGGVLLVLSGDQLWKTIRSSRYKRTQSRVLKQKNS